MWKTGVNQLEEREVGPALTHSWCTKQAKASCSSLEHLRESTQIHACYDKRTQITLCSFVEILPCNCSPQHLWRSCEWLSQSGNSAMVCGPNRHHR